MKSTKNTCFSKSHMISYCRKVIIGQSTYILLPRPIRVQAPSNMKNNVICTDRACPIVNDKFSPAHYHVSISSVFPSHLSDDDIDIVQDNDPR